MTTSTSPAQHGRADLTVAEQAMLAAELGLNTSAMASSFDQDAAASAQAGSKAAGPISPLHCIEAAGDLEQDAAASAQASTTYNGSSGYGPCLIGAVDDGDSAATAHGPTHILALGRCIG